MKKAYLAFYKGNGDWFDRLIQWWTKGNYSHVELVVDNFWMSSSRRDGGVRTKLMYPNLDNKWDMVEIPWADVDRAVRWFSDNDGKLYDTRGILGFVFRAVSDQKVKYFCSEAVATALGFEEAWRLDPNTFAAVAKRVTLDFYQKNSEVQQHNDASRVDLPITEIPKMSQQIDLNKVQFTLPLNGAEGQVVMNALAALPYAQVAELVERLKAQFTSAVQAMQVEAVAAADAALEEQADA